MTLIALASVKGSPGVTTAATALAASWPEGRQVLLVEADPFGGDLAPTRYGMAPTGGLASLFAAARRTLAPEDVWDHVDRLPGGLPVLFGLGGTHQAVANEKAWPIVADALCSLEADVVVDVGRLLPNLAGGVRELLARADALLILCQSTLEVIVHLREALPGLAAEMRGRSLLVVPTGTGQFSAADIGRTLQVEVLPTVPEDPAAAEALGNRRSVRRLERTRLLRWADHAVGALGIPAGPPVGSEVEVPHDEQLDPLLETGLAEESLSLAHPSPGVPVEVPQLGDSECPSRTDARLAGAGTGSTGEVVR